MNIFDRFRPYPELKMVIVNLRSGTSFRAVVMKCAGQFVVLRNVTMMQDRDNTARKVVDGEVIVKLADVDFMQVVN
jgi:small nuclear ribonucleoprotein (snRNP)-like protein